MMYSGCLMVMTQDQTKTVKGQAAHIDSVDLLVMDVESSLGELLLPGVKALQVAFIVTHKPAHHICM